jgi:hypothetical protein
MNYYEGDNIGGIRTLDIIRHDLPIGFNPVQLPIGSSWINIPFKDESGVLIPKTELSDNGTIYNYSGSFLIPNMRDEVDQELLPFCGKAIAILRIIDMNGRVQIIGSPDTPVTLNLAATTGQKYTNENGSQFNFSVDQIAAALPA